jgi:putative peptidoglycan lipid II flippase
MPKLVKYAGIVFVLSFLARSTGFLRNILFVNKMGVSVHSDAFFVAVAAVDFFILFFGLNALKSVATTTYSRECSGQSDTGPFLSSIIISTSLLGLVLSIPLLVAPGALARVFAPGFTGSAAEMTVLCLRLMALLVLFKGVLPVLESLLGVQRRFVSQNIFMPFVNITTILVVLASPPRLILPLFCVSFTASFGLACAGSYVLVARGVRLPRVSVDEFFRHTGRFAHLAFPLLFATTVYSLAEITDRMIATFFQKGVVTSMGVAHSLCFMSTFVLLEPIAKVLFPHFSRLFFENRHEQLARDYQLGQFIIIITFIPVSFFFVFFSRDLVAAVLVARKISAADIDTTVRMLSVYAVALIFNAGFFLPSYLLQSAQKNAYVGRVSAWVFLGKVICSTSFAYLWGYIGIPIGTLVAFIVNCILLNAGVRKHLNIGLSMHFLSTVATATAISGAASWITGMVHLPDGWFASAPVFVKPVSSCAARIAVYAALAGTMIIAVYGKRIREVLRMRSAG